MGKRKSRPHIFKKTIAVILGDPNKPDPMKRDGKFNPEDFETIAKLKAALAVLKEFYFSFFDNHDTLESDLIAVRKNIWLVLNLCDEGFMNDPRREKHIPILLEKLGLPFTGAGAACMEKCYDKLEILELANLWGIPTPRTYEKPTDARIFPIIIKPRFGDGGHGITASSVVWSAKEIIERLKELGSKMPHSNILMQEFLEGQDLTCGIINGEVLPIIEEDYSCLPPDLPPIQGYEAKWQPDSPYWQVTSKLANIPEDTKTLVQIYTKKIVEITESHDYARIDWRLDKNGVPRLLEVNPNPGWCWDGHLAKTWKLMGRSYEKMLEEIIKSAAKRYDLK